MNSNKIEHHEVRLKLEPENGTLKAIDRIYISGSDKLNFHLGNRFDLLSIEQDLEDLDWIVEEKGKLTTRYVVKGLDPEKDPLKMMWEGTLDSFENYGVCIIRKDLVELSGFCWWFPTIEPQSQFERFTYDLKVEIPDKWKVVTPGKEIKNDLRHFRYRREIEDIFICASPSLKPFRRNCCDITLELYVPDSLRKFKEELMDDFSSSIELCSDLFGKLKEDNGGLAVISPRGKDGAEWGFERDGLWVVGDTFARYLIENDWKVDGMWKSLSLHETIHGWFGIGVEFKEPWLAEAITQYLEVILTAMMFDELDLEKKYFDHYRDRVEERLAKEDRPVKEYTFTDNMYTHWYLKGSWAFWDLEEAVGREELLEFFRKIYQNNLDDSLSQREFTKILEKNFDLESSFMEHWFEETGFDPLYRSLS